MGERNIEREGLKKGFKEAEDGTWAYPMKLEGSIGIVYILRKEKDSGE
jgi:hypothetical protein